MSLSRRHLALGVLALGGIAYAGWPATSAAAASGPTPDGEVFTVRRADLRITLTENGRLVAKESQKVKSQLQSEAKLTFLLEEGKEVQEGDVVCRLDPKAVQTQLEQLELEALAAERDLKTARGELAIQKVENEANVAKAKVALERAGQELEKYREGEVPQERRKLKVAIKNAETDWLRAKKNLEDSQKLLEQNYIKRSELEDHQIAFERTEVEKDGAELALRMFEKYTFPMQITELSTKLGDATREVTTAEQRADSTLGTKEVAVQQAEKRLEVLRTQISDRRQDIDNMTMKAPCPGLVVHGDPQYDWREKPKVGSLVYQEQTVLTIPDLRILQVKVFVHEADIGKLKPGLPALVTTDSYPGLVLRGEVTKIANMAGDFGDSEVRKFPVEVTLQPQQDIAIKPGISAKVEIQSDLRPATLFVPQQSVFAEDGQHYCHVRLQPAGHQRRAVRIGAQNDVFVEILDGLAEGDGVLLYNPTLPAAGPSSPTPAATTPAATTPAATAPAAANAGDK